MAAGDLNTIYGATDDNRLALPARDRTITDRMDALGLEFLGPRYPAGRRASPAPQGLPPDSQNIPTYYTTRQQLFVSGDWAAKTGIPAENSEIWQPGWSLNLEAFDAYRREVQQSMDALLADLDPATLDDEIEAFGSPRRRGWMLRVEMSNHILSHLGEIFTLRGMKGLAGLPI